MKKIPSNILVIRTSAMGDVAMTVPVLWSLSKSYPDAKLTMLTTESFAPMFENISNLKLVFLDKKEKHKGFVGLIRLFKSLQTYRFDAVADLHDVLRSKVLRWLFFLSGVKMAKINKGRNEKKQLIAQGKDFSSPLKTSFNRYYDVFQRLGFDFELKFQSIFENNIPISNLLIETFGEKKGNWIGIAPFAKHRGKIYPLEKMEQVVALLNEEKSNSIFLFGSGEEEKKIILSWVEKYDRILLLPVEFRLPEELILMAHLDVMLSMDSANMHLASLVGTPVVSIWGATHYYAGFLGWNQSLNHVVEIDLDCRPCSIFGNKTCRRNDYACLNWIEAQSVVERIKKIYN